MSIDSTGWRKDSVPEKLSPSAARALAASASRILRGAILHLLQEQGGEPLNSDVLLGTLDRLHYRITAVKLAAELAYLRDRGYVDYEELKVRELPRVRIVRVRITAKGTDLLEGTVTDEGVDVE